MVTVAARWVEPTRRNAPLSAYARDAEIRALDLLEQSLARSGSRPVNEVVIRRLLGSASGDIDELRPQLEARASAMEESATERLHERGERESRDLRETLESQRRHVGGELARRESALVQRTLAFSQAEERQLTADMRSWRRRLEQFDRDLEQEPRRVRDFYEVRAVPPVEPLGIVYLWPETN